MKGLLVLSTPPSSTFTTKPPAVNVPERAALTLALTVGDADGIGPEITAKVLQQFKISQPPFNLQVIGDIEVLRRQTQHLNLDWITHPALTYVPITTPPHQGGAWEAMHYVVSSMAQGQVDGLVTGPIAKHHLHTAGLPYTGHTEMLEVLANTLIPSTNPYKADMVFVYQALRLLLLTRHIPLSEVPKALECADLDAQLTHFAQWVSAQVSHPKPSIALMALNPHAGEVGGTEDQTILAPLLTQLNQTNPIAHWAGPLAADGLMRGLNPAAPHYDAYVACYHDQGLIPMKLLGGWATVNVTIGLPFIRTSVSHGTAPDIAGQGLASPDSLLAALECAHQLALNATAQPPTLPAFNTSPLEALGR